jgi:hypothetical protein
MDLSAQPKSINDADSLLKTGIDAMIEENNYAKALEIFDMVRDASEQLDWHEQLFLALNNMGISHYMMFDYGEALNYYLQAYTVSLKYLDDQQNMIVLSNIAILYSKEKNYDKAWEYFSKAYDMAKENKDMVKVGFYGINLASICNKIDRLDQAKDYIDEVLPLIANMEDKYANMEDKYMKANLVRVENILLRKNYRQVIEECNKLTEETEIEEHPALISKSYSMMSEAWLWENNLDSAAYYSTKALHASDDIENKADIYSLLSDINYKMRQYDNRFYIKIPYC